jgi:ABC-type amino acid transport substrate-binding protein
MRVGAAKQVSLASLVTSVLLLSAAFPAFAAGNDAAAVVKARGKLVVVCFPQQGSPFISVNTAAGPMPKVGGADRFNGIDVEILSGFAKSLGVQLELFPIDVPQVSELLPSLQRGDGDILIGGFTITTDRQKVVDFTVPYHQIHDVVVVQRDSKITSLDGLVGVKAVALAGASQIEVIKKLAIRDLQLQTVEFVRDGYTAVKNGTADVFFSESDDAKASLTEFDTLKIGFTLPSTQSIAYALPKGSNLVTALNAYLVKIKASGELSRIISKHTQGGR